MNTKYGVPFLGHAAHGGGAKIENSPININIYIYPNNPQEMGEQLGEVIGETLKLRLRPDVDVDTMIKQFRDFFVKKED